MSKKPFVITIIVIVAIAGVLAIISASQGRSTTFTIKQPATRVAIFRTKDTQQPIKTVTSDQPTIRLKEGTYYFAVQGDKFAPERKEFIVGDANATVIVDPDYSSSYLANLLPAEIGAINTAITAKYPQTARDYEVVDGRLYKKGEWFGAIIKQKVDPRDITDLYRIILKKTDNTWQVVNRPEIIATTRLFPSVPPEVLQAINNIGE